MFEDDQKCSLFCDTRLAPSMRMKEGARRSSDGTKECRWSSSHIIIIIIIIINFQRTCIAPACCPSRLLSLPSHMVVFRPDWNCIIRSMADQAQRRRYQTAKISSARRHVARRILQSGLTIFVTFRVNELAAGDSHNSPSTPRPPRLSIRVQECPVIC